MSTEDGHRPEGGPAPLVRRRINRTSLAVGTAGLAAVLGTGAYAVTSQIVDGSKQTAAHEVTSPTPVASQANPIPAVVPSASGSPSASPVPTKDASGRPIPSHVVEEIREARRKMAEDGVPVKPPVLPKTAPKPVSDIQRTTKGSLKEGGIIRTVTARGDLSGQEELAYVAGGIRKYGKTECSQTFQFSTNPKPAKKENLLMCWRTSPAKSVIAMVVDPDGSPSPKKAVAVLERQWRKMG